jgi:two-component system, NarL family, sensor kinase
MSLHMLTQARSRAFPMPGIALPPASVDPRVAWWAEDAGEHERADGGEAVLVRALEAERKRIALDLHDGLGQSLTLIKLNAQNSSELLAAGAAAQAQEVLQSVLQRVNDALREVRRACSELWPPMLDDLGLVPTLSCLLREFAVSCPGVELDARIEVREPDVPKPLHAPIYRILQEAMHNVVKHARASRVAVQLRRDDRAIVLVVRDNGRGFDAAGRCMGGMGLAGMRQRACMSHGDYALRSRPGRGTRICVSWLLPAGGSAP